MYQIFSGVRRDNNYARPTKRSRQREDQLGEKKKMRHRALAPPPSPAPMGSSRLASGGAEGAMTPIVPFDARPCVPEGVESSRPAVKGGREGGRPAPFKIDCRGSTRSLGMNSTRTEKCSVEGRRRHGGVRVPHSAADSTGFAEVEQRPTFGPRSADLALVTWAPRPGHLGTLARRAPN